MAFDLARLLRPLAVRVANMVARAVVSGVDDSAKAQLLQLEILAGEVRGDVERFQNYGFTSRPLEGAEAAVVFVAGRREHGLALAVEDRRYRIRNLESGEVVVYDSNGSTIKLKATGDVEIVPASGVVRVTGAVDVTGDVTAAGVSLQHHTHLAGTLASPSGAVTGVTGSPSP